MFWHKALFHLTEKRTVAELARRRDVTCERCGGTFSRDNGNLDPAAVSPRWTVLCGHLFISVA